MSDDDLKKTLGIITEAELAQIRGVKVSALRNERARGEGPPYQKFGRSVVYPLSGIRKYLKAATVTPKKAPTLATESR